jgi:AraC-like DNA-binding protein
VLAYLLCQQADVLLSLPRWMVLLVLAMCVSSTAWMWLAARGLFHDRFRITVGNVAPVLAMMVLGLAANMPYLADAERHVPVAFDSPLSRLHAVGMLAFTAAALWEVARGWQDDLVEPRRAARRWVVMGIVIYAALALVVELAVRGHGVGRLLPALHVAGIGALALGLALLVTRRSLEEVLGCAQTPSTTGGEPPPEYGSNHTRTLLPPVAPDPLPTRESEALTRLERAMNDQRAYRREGLSVAGLADLLGIAEGTLRAVINQRLGYRNFNDFLHHYRVREAAARLSQEDLPILTIALECGYGSIGPFNRAFKERMGMTPSEYRGASRLGGGAATN